MNDLADWLLEQIAADEAVIASAPDWREPFSDLVGCYDLSWEEKQHIRTWGIERARAECDAKRRIVALHSDDAPWCGWTQGGEGTHGDMGIDPGNPQPRVCGTLRLLALPYADRPGYRQEWAPDTP